MPAQSDTTAAVDRARDQIPACTLDDVGLHEQRARYSRLARSVIRTERESEAVSIEFDQAFDRQALDAAFAVERECCPFFRFALDERHRQLRVTVTNTEMLPALEAIALAFDDADPVTPTSKR